MLSRPIFHCVVPENIQFPPRRKLEIPERLGGGGGGGGGIKGPGNSGEVGGGGGVVCEFTFPIGQVRCHANLF